MPASRFKYIAFCLSVIVSPFMWGQDISAIESPHATPIQKTAKGQLTTGSKPVPNRRKVKLQPNRILASEQQMKAPKVTSVSKLISVIAGEPLPLEIESRSALIKYPRPIKSLPPRTKDNAAYDIHYLDLKEGMNSNGVTSIIQDSHGYYWFSTYGGGVTKYDGTTFTQFTIAEGLSYNVVRILQEDDEGNIWMGTHGGGVTIYDGQRFTTVDMSGGLPSNRIRSMTKDRQGNIWIGTDDAGLIKYQEGQWLHYSKEQGLSSNSIRSILQDSKGGFWIGTDDAGLMYYDGEQIISLSENDGLSYNRIRGLLEDEDGSIWICTYGRGVDVYDGHTITNYSSEQGLSSNQVWSVIKSQQGDYWFTTYEGGACKFDGQSFTTFDDQNGMNSNLIWTVFQDDHGSLWFGTESGGVCKYDPNSFNHYNEQQGLSHPLVYAIDTLNNGNLIFGTLGGGITIKNKNAYSYLNSTNGLQSDRIRDFVKDKDDNLWIATDGAGAAYYDGQQITSLNTDHGLIHNNVWSIIIDDEDNVWMSGSSGVSKYDGTNFTNYTTESGLSSNRQNSSFKDSKGNLWFGTIGGGVNKYDGQSFTHFTKQQGLSDDIVLAIHEDREGNMWFGTFSGGLNRWDGTSFNTINTDNGLSNNTVWAIIDDADGNMWIATEGGVSTFNPLAWEDEDAITTFRERDGLKSESVHSLFIDGDNQLWIGCSKNLSSITLSDLDPTRAIPSVTLEYIEIDQVYSDFRNVAEGTYDYNSVVSNYNYPLGLKLPYDKNWIGFHVTTTGSSNPSTLQYQYQLVGTDHTWSPVTSDVTIDYNNLSSGTYTFEARTREPQGAWSDTFEYSFHISPPWWETKVAYLLYILTICGILYWLYQFQINREKLKNKLAFEQKEAQRLLELDQIKADFFSNISHEFKTPITLILEPVRQLLNEKIPQDIKKRLKLVKRNSDTLLHLVNELLDVSKIESGQMSVDARVGNYMLVIHPLFRSFFPLAEKKGLGLSISGEQQLIDSVFDHDKVEKIVRNLLSNAIKYTHEGIVNLDIQHVQSSDGGSQLQLIVKDTGPGISKDNLGKIFNRFFQVEDSNYKHIGSTGIGLSLTKELVELMSGTINVDSTVGQGSSFTVRLPMIIQEGDTQSPIIEPELKYIKGHDAQSAIPGSHASQEEDAHKPLVLLIEDNADLREFITGSIAANFQIIESVNGEEGCIKAKERIPDLIISDLMMPIKDGYEVCRDLKKDTATAHIPIILLTAKGSIDHKIEGWDVGADAYLTKPFHTEELIIRISKLIEGRQALQSIFQSKTINNAIDESEKLLNPVDQLFLKDTIEHIDQHISDPEFTVELLAQSVFISRAQLFRKMKAITGQSPKEFIKNYKLEKAIELRNTKNYTNMELATFLGFKDEKYFKKLLKIKSESNN